MTLEEASKTFAVRWPLATCALVLRAMAMINPRFPGQLAKKMRALFSTRVNSILHEQLFVGAIGPSASWLSPRFLFCNTALDVEINLDLSDYTQGNIYFNGLPGFFLDLISFVDSETAFFDLGANMGLVSAAMAKFVDNKHIIAVEAMPDSYERLKTVFRKNCPEALAFNVALSSGDSDLNFNIPSGDSGSASATIAAKDLARAGFRKTHMKSVWVKGCSFDDLFKQIDSADRFSSLAKHAFKIDVEGHEVEVIQGMNRYFADYRGEIFIVVEVRNSTADYVDKLLTGHGFSREGREASAFPVFHLADLVYRRRGKLEVFR